MHMPGPPPYGGPLATPQYQQPVAPGWQPPPAPYPIVPQPNQSLALASSIFGGYSLVFGWCCSTGLLTGPVAIGLGIFSLIQIKNNPAQYGGKPLAIIGIAGGGLYLLFGLMMLLLYGLGFFLQALGQ
jgi:hypothetical protein